ncbi:MAG: Gfo/Idh/MocA family oxidoreductase [Capnocytophaga sp.]|nr:Gfo/Idh/MocA family oxidoreductase [Capnocytophaga sp.]
MKVLIIGLGSIAKKHINSLRKINAETEIFALRSSKSATKTEGVTDIFSIDEVDMQMIDFVIISNPTFKHYNAIYQVFSYEKPLFIEKPLFSEITKQTDTLVKQITDKKLITYIACNLRFLEALQFLKKEIQGKRINEVNVYCGSYLPDWRPNVDFRTVYSANKEQGGGVHIDLIHELDYVYWLFGEPEQTRTFFSNNSSLNISAYDYANYLWIYRHFSVSVVLNYYRKDSKRTIEIITDTGTYEVDILKNTVDFNKKCIFASPKKTIDTYDDQMWFFINEIIPRKKQFNNIEEANKILKLCIKD